MAVVEVMIGLDPVVFAVVGSEICCLETVVSVVQLIIRANLLCLVQGGQDSRDLGCHYALACVYK